MSKFLSILSLAFVFSMFTSCFKDGDDLNKFNDFSVVGTWELTMWTIQESIDLNDDTISSMNLLDEASCDNNETLKFDDNGTVSSNMTYNPQVTISLRDGSTDDYIFNVVCDMDGTIGTASEYTQNSNSVTLFNTSAVLNGNQLTVVYEDAIDIYNEALTEVVATKDLTLVYTKK